MAASLLQGILVGHTLVLVSVCALAKCYIFTRANRAAAAAGWLPSHETVGWTASAEDYLRMATHSFVCMILSGIIITVSFSNVDPGTTPSMQEYSMNSLCSYFDLPPAAYVMPAHWLLTAYGILRFCALDTQRLLQTSLLPRWCRCPSIIVNGLFVFVAALFSTIWSVSLESDVVGHELPFLLLVCCFPVVYIMQCLQVSFIRKPTRVHVITLSLFFQVSWFYALALVALRHGHMNPDYAEVSQWAWVVLIFLCPFATYPPRAPPCVVTNRVQVQPAIAHAPEEPAIDIHKVMVQPAIVDAPEGLASDSHKIQVLPANFSSSEAHSPSTSASQCHTRTPESAVQPQTEEPLALLDVDEEQLPASHSMAGARILGGSLSHAPSASPTPAQAVGANNNLSAAAVAPPRMDAHIDLRPQSGGTVDVHFETQTVNPSAQLGERGVPEAASSFTHRVLKDAVQATADKEPAATAEDPEDEDVIEEV